MTEAPAKPEPVLPPYRPVSRRRRWLIALLSLASVWVIAVEMLDPHRQLMNAKAKRADAAAMLACPSGAAMPAPGCPGSKMDVQVLPAANPGSADTGRR
jgi:hypothetical protein